MYRYRFYLRSGKTVTLSMIGAMEKSLLSIGQAIDLGQRPEDQWLSEPGFSRAVRWTDIEGWEPDSETLPRVTTDNPNIIKEG